MKLEDALFAGVAGLDKGPKLPSRTTVYAVEWSDPHGSIRYFEPNCYADMWQFFSDRLRELDKAPKNAAWVSVKRLPDSIYPQETQLAHWTKISDERTPSQGSIVKPD